MNLIEKLIEDAIKELEDDIWLFTRACEIDSDDTYSKEKVIELTARLTDLRNALQEYREMLKAVCEHYIIKSEKYKGLNVCSKCGIYKPERQMPISPLKNPD